MIKVCGYKAFRGKMLISPKGNIRPPFIVDGDWLYKPEYDCWYSGASSYPADICEIIEDNSEDVQ